MTRRRWLVITPLSILVVSVGALLLRPDPPLRPSRATFEKVRVGMTWDEAVATVGGPPGNYDDPGEHIPFTTSADSGVQLWQADEYLLVVMVRDGRIVSADVGPIRLPVWDRLLIRLGF